MTVKQGSGRQTCAREGAESSCIWLTGNGKWLEHTSDPKACRTHVLQQGHTHTYTNKATAPNSSIPYGGGGHLPSDHRNIDMVTEWSLQVCKNRKLGYPICLGISFAVVMQPVWWRCFLRWGSFFPNDSSVCLASTADSVSTWHANTSLFN